MLEGLLADVDGRAAAVDVLSAAEHGRVLEEWKRTVAAGAAEVSVVGRFEAQVAATPDATALIIGERTVSYRELNSRANRPGALPGGAGRGSGEVRGGGAAAVG
ncbi:hypothetical protein SCALM49S_06697 [Streptomyces californicus]